MWSLKNRGEEGILRARGGSSLIGPLLDLIVEYSPRTRR